MSIIIACDCGDCPRLACERVGDSGAKSSGPVVIATFLSRPRYPSTSAVGIDWLAQVRS